MDLILLLAFVVFCIVLVALSLRQKHSDKSSQTHTLQPGVKTPAGPYKPQPVKTEATRPSLQGAAYVVDGDTIVILKTQIRLFGVDAPELNHPHGKKAKWALASLCKGKTVRAKVTDTDTQGRTVARCYLPDGRDLSAEMVKAGLAIDWARYSGGIYRPLEVPAARKTLWLAGQR